MKYLYSAIILFNILPLELQGQAVIEGLVRNNSTKEPIASAQIFSLERGEIQEKATTKNDGTFVIGSNFDSICVEHPNFIRQCFSVPKNDAYIFEMATAIKLTLSDPVIIYENKILYEAETSRSLTRKEMSLYPPNNSVALLNAVNGVHMQSGGYNTNKLSIRGIGSRSQFETSDAKIFYNDIPVHSSIGESAIEDLGIYVGNKIELIKGHTGAQYESGFGGAIVIDNINVRSANETQISSENNFSKWNHFQTTNTVNIGRTNHSNTHNFYLVQSFLQNNGFRDNNEVERTNWTINYTANFKGKIKLTALYNHVALKAFIPSSLNFEEYLTSPEKAAFIWKQSKGNEDYTKVLYGLNLRYQVNHQFSTEHTIYRNSFVSSELRPFNTIDENFQSLGLKGKLKYEIPIKNQVFEMGYRIQRENYDFTLFETNIDKKGSPFNNGKEQRWITELYLRSITEIDEKWKILIAGNIQHLILSSNENEVLSETYILPEAMLTHYLNYNNRLYLRIGKGVSYFSPSQALLPDGNFSKELSPQLGWDITAGMKGEVFNKRLAYRISIYNMWIKNMITSTRNIDNQAINASNGSAQYSGLESDFTFYLIGQQHTTKKFASCSFRCSVNNNKFTQFINDEQDYSNNKVPGTPQFTWGANFNYKLNSFSFNTRYSYVDSYHMRDDNSILSPTTHLLHATLGYDIYDQKPWTIAARIDVQNMLDEAYSSMTLVNASSFGGATPRYYYPGLPRHIMFTINLKYQI